MNSSLKFPSLKNTFRLIVVYFIRYFLKFPFVKEIWAKNKEFNRPAEKKKYKNMIFLLNKDRGSHMRTANKKMRFNLLCSPLDVCDSEMFLKFSLFHN